MTQNGLPPGETGILRALHKDTDERQWQRVLALALREYLGNARAFAEAVLRSAAQDKTGGQRTAALLDRLPKTVRCSPSSPSTPPRGAGRRCSAVPTWCFAPAGGTTGQSSWSSS